MALEKNTWGEEPFESLSPLRTCLCGMLGEWREHEQALWRAHCQGGQPTGRPAGEARMHQARGISSAPMPSSGAGGGALSSSGVRCLNSRMFPGSPYWEVLLEMAIVCSCPPLARSGGRGLDPGLLSLLAAAGGQD